MPGFAERSGSAESPVSKTYRQPRKFLVIGLVCTSVFAAVGIGSFFAAWTNADGSFKYPRPTAVVTASFWSFWVLLGVYQIVSYYRSSLVIARRFVRVVGCFRTREVDLAWVHRAVWRRFPRFGRLILYEDARRLTVYFGNFGPAAPRELAPFLRAVLPARVQEGWERFRDQEFGRRDPGHD